MVRGQVAMATASDAIGTERLASSGREWKLSVMHTGGLYTYTRACAASAPPHTHFIKLLAGL